MPPSPVTATVSFTQPPLGYDIVLPLQEIVVEPGGGDAEVAVSYAHRTGPVKMTFMFASFPGGVSLPQQWSVTPKENYNLNLHMDVNNTWKNVRALSKLLITIRLTQLFGSGYFHLQPATGGLQHSFHLPRTAQCRGGKQNLYAPARLYLLQRQYRVLADHLS